MFENWTYRKFPERVGDYWFYGQRFKTSDEMTMRHCKVINRSTAKSEGSFLFREELGSHWWFIDATIPTPPETSKFLEIQKKKGEPI